MPSRVANIAPCITQVTVQLVHYTLLINQLWFGRTFFIALFNNMRTLKFKAQPTNAFFATVNQMFGGSSQLPTMLSELLTTVNYLANSLHTFSRHSRTFLELLFIYRYNIITSFRASIYVVLRHSVACSKVFHSATVESSSKNRNSSIFISTLHKNKGINGGVDKVVRVAQT